MYSIQSLSSSEGKLDHNGEINDDAVSRRWDRQRAYGLSLGGVNVLLPIGVFCEYFAQPNITPLPNAPNYFVGLVNLRGNLAPVYDLASFVHGDKTAAPIIAKQLVALGKGENCAALACDAPPQTFDLTESSYDNDFSRAPEAIAPLLARCFVIGGSQWYELDFRTAFTQLAAQ
ncbi:MAG TPA: chemotaxis protein CheW [Marinagarivorans sp.]